MRILGGIFFLATFFWGVEGRCLTKGVETADRLRWQAFLYWLDRREIETALSWLEYWRELDPDSPATALAAANLALLQGDFQSAEEAFFGLLLQALEQERLGAPGLLQGEGGFSALEGLMAARGCQGDWEGLFQAWEEIRSLEGTREPIDRSVAPALHSTALQLKAGGPEGSALQWKWRERLSQLYPHLPPLSR